MAAADFFSATVSGVILFYRKEDEESPGNPDQYAHLDFFAHLLLFLSGLLLYPSVYHFNIFFSVPSGLQILHKGKDASPDSS
jgi:hypothetical protein